jgi:hypothetical protein
MTDAQRRILEDFADRKLLTLYRQDGQTRSTRKEWEAEREALVVAGWLETGLAIAGCGHSITGLGRAALKEAQMLDAMKGPVLS